jgi:hypothetical protein
MIIQVDNLWYYGCGDIEVYAPTITELRQAVLKINNFDILIYLN